MRVAIVAADQITTLLIAQTLKENGHTPEGAIIDPKLDAEGSHHSLGSPQEVKQIWERISNPMPEIVFIVLPHYRCRAEAHLYVDLFAEHGLAAVALQIEDVISWIQRFGRER